MKTLIICTAVPASGKSTWSKYYASHHENTLIVSSDEIRREVTGCYTDQSRQKEVWELFSKRIHEYGKIDNVTVILDALNDSNELRLKYVKENPEFDKYVLVVFPHDYESCIKRNSTRNPEKMVPPDVMKALVSKFEEPSEEVKNLFQEIINVKDTDECFEEKRRK